MARCSGAMHGPGAPWITLVSGRIANEDLFNLRSFSDHLGGSAALYSDMAGGDLVAKVGVGQGTTNGVSGKTTTEMMSIGTYASGGWDIAHVRDHSSEIWYVDDTEALQKQGPKSKVMMK